VVGSTRNTELPKGSEATEQLRRLDIERLIDEIVAQSFPASDPPAWGVVASLMRRETPA
jgi:hypothetical protein